MAVPSPRLSWYRSFYWRIGITFVAFVVVFLIAQGIILRQGTAIQAPFELFRAPVLAAEVAAEVADSAGSRAGRRAERSPQVSISAAERRPSRMDRVRRLARRTRCSRVRPGRCPGSSGSPRCRRSAGGASRPATPSAPSPPRRWSSTIGSSVWCWCWCGLRCRSSEASAFLANSACSCHCRARSLLIGAAVVVAMVLFYPARRRLRALEHAAQRLGEGDLSCESAAEGRRRDRSRGRGVQPYGRGAGDARRRASHLRCAAPADDGRRLT